MQRAAELGETLFFSSPPLLQLYIVGSAREEHPYGPVRAALASTHSRGFDCTRRAVHR